MRNPLYKRLPRELKEEFGKYLVIFVLLVFLIGLVSGFLIADDSLMNAYTGSFETYQVEYGNFRVEKQLNKTKIKAIEAGGVSLYENFYITEYLDEEHRLRIFKNRSEVNTLSVWEGRLPEQENEIVLDRMFAVNNQYEVGDVLELSGIDYTIVGLVAFPDYSCLFENNNDSMFDSILFGVAAVSEEGFAALEDKNVTYSYSWLYDETPESEIQEKEWADDLMDLISEEAVLEDYVPRYLNQAIQFTGDDMGGDRAMIQVLLYIIILILAFVFAVTTGNTITKEANVIGTLRASGYTRGELLRHYLLLPLVVTLLGAAAGNVAGYTYFKDFCADMYLGSYSLTTYEITFNGTAFWQTTVVPFFIMLLVNVFVLKRKLKFSPLAFLRRDIGGKRKKKGVKLSKRIPFFTRFRLRVIFQNMPNYVVLFVGILFANLLLFFGMALPDILENYKANIENTMFCNYQYMLSVPSDAFDEDKKLFSMFSLLRYEKEVETENETAEKYSVYSLRTMKEGAIEEDVVLYGITEDSAYVSIDFTDYEEGDVCVSSAFAMKHSLAVGDTLSLKEKYSKDTYEFQIVEINDYDSSICLFMPMAYLNAMFDYPEDFFCGYFSNTPIEDIDEEYIGSVVDLEALTKTTRQLDVSMGSMMYLVDVIAVILFVILIYLLSKLIIEKNMQSISMIKILGYNNREVFLLYVLPTSFMVLLFLAITIPMEYWLIQAVWNYYILRSIAGWITYEISTMLYVKMYLLGVISYGVVAFMELFKIKSIPMDLALKNVE